MSSIGKRVFRAGGLPSEARSVLATELGLLTGSRVGFYRTDAGQSLDSLMSLRVGSDRVFDPPGQPDGIMELSSFADTGTNAVPERIVHVTNSTLDRVSGSGREAYSTGTGPTFALYKNGPSQPKSVRLFPSLSVVMQAGGQVWLDDSPSNFDGMRHTLTSSSHKSPLATPESTKTFAVNDQVHNQTLSIRHFTFENPTTQASSFAGPSSPENEEENEEPRGRSRAGG